MILLTRVEGKFNIHDANQSTSGHEIHQQESPHTLLK